MPELQYDYRPDWQYLFPVPTVDLEMENSLSGPPALAACVGVDGREKGVLRRFPGFKLVEDAVSGVSSVLSLTRVWYAAIQKGTTSHSLRGFVSLTLRTDGHYQAHFRAYDTQSGTWSTYELLNFSTTDYGLAGARWIDTIVGYPVDAGGSLPLSGGVYAPSKGIAYIMGDNPLTTGIDSYELDLAAGRITRFIGSSTTASTPQDLAWDNDNSILYMTDGTSLYTVNTSAGSLTLKGAHGGGITDMETIAYDTVTDKLYGIRGSVTNLYDIDVTTGVATDTGVVLARIYTGINYELSTGKLLGVDSSTKTVWSINVTTGAETVEISWTSGGNSGVLPPKWIIPRAVGLWYGLHAQGGLMEIETSAAPYAMEGYDFAAQGRYLYGVLGATNRRRPLNFAWFWDVDTATLQRRIMGATHAPIFISHWADSIGDGVLGDAAATLRVFAAVQLYNKRHGVFSPLSIVQSDDLAAGATNRRLIASMTAPDLGITGTLGKEVEITTFRSIQIDVTDYPDDVTLIADLFPDTTNDPITDLTTSPTVTAGSSKETAGYARNDDELSVRVPFDPIGDFVGVMPRAFLIAATEDQTFVVNTPYAAEDPTTIAEESLTRVPNRILWSPPDQFALENFRGAVTGEQFRFPDPTITVLKFQRVGDYLFAVTNSGVVRFHKSGSYVAVQPLLTKWGATNRDQVTSFEDVLLLVTNSGLKAIDPATMGVTNFGGVQRLLSSVENWRSTISSVKLAYDAQLNAIMMINGTLEEMCLLWPDSGGITFLEDCPFVFPLEGLDITAGGVRRSYWVTLAGKVFTPDSEETSTRKTMAGLSSSDTVNGTATAGTTTGLTDSTAAFGSQSVGFYVRFLSGANIGLKRKITATTATTLAWGATLPSAIAAGDRYAVAPIPFRVRGWQILVNGQIHHFRRKIATSMKASVDLRAGETNPETNPNLKMIYRMYKRMDSTPIVSVEVGMHEDPTRMEAAFPVGGIGGFLLSPEWATDCSDVDFQLLAAEVSGKLTTRASDSSP